MRYLYEKLNKDFNLRCDGNGCNKMADYRVGLGDDYCKKCLAKLEQTDKRYMSGLQSINCGTKYTYLRTQSFFSLCRICDRGGHYFDDLGGPYKTKSYEVICGKCLREKEETDVCFALGFESVCGADT